MRLFTALAAVALLATGCSGGRPGTATTYGPSGILGGYSETQIEPGVWRVTGRSNGIAEQGFGRNMAVYRAAELMKAAGFSHFQMLDQKGSATMMRLSGGSTRAAGESLTVTVRGVDDPAAPLACRAKRPDACATLAVDTVMASIGPRLTFRKVKPAAASEAR